MNKFAHGLPKDLYKGMRVRPSMDMIVNYIEKDPYKIKYPNRDATFYLNSPQFLNLLNDSGLDLEEQSKNLAKQQLMQSQRTASGLGGAVDTAMIGSDSDSVQSVSSDGSSSYRRRVEQELDRVREQQRIRQQNEELYRRQQESIERQRQERERSFELAARRSLGLTTAHPVASASAASAAQSFTLPPAVLGQIAQQFLQRAGVIDIPITYLQPPGSQTITPVRPHMYYIGSPPSPTSSPPQQADVLMTQAATKRGNGGESSDESPRAKAKAGLPLTPIQQTASASAASSSSATGSRVRGVSVDPQLKYIEAARDAKKLSMDPALRSDGEHLNTLRNSVLRELLKLEGYTHINIPTLGKTNVDKAIKPDMINAIINHYAKGKGKGTS
jgi:hypothetical protein